MKFDMICTFQTLLNLKDHNIQFKVMAIAVTIDCVGQESIVSRNWTRGRVDNKEKERKEKRQNALADKPPLTLNSWTVYYVALIRVLVSYWNKNFPSL